MANTRYGAWLDDAGAHFRLWAPSASRVDLLIDGAPASAMSRDARGVFTAAVPGLGKGARYRYRLDESEPIPDPASRWQPEGVHGASAIDDPRAFAWSSSPMTLAPRDLIIYELHVGAFTPDGTFDAARDRLPYLRDLGVTAIELMPIAEFAGSRNWGYDGAALYAPSSAYGGPDALRRFVDAAHAHGLAVLLDVVYNHLGPDGAYLHAASPAFFTPDDASPWGAAVDVANPIVREWLIGNAIHWADDFRVDGFRLDATHALPRASAPAFIRELVTGTRAAVGRPLLFIAEDHRKIPGMLRPAREDGWALDAVWADDFHHHVRVMTAGDTHGYYASYSGHARGIAATIAGGWDGVPSAETGHEQFVICIQNHDQIGNRASGDRLHHTQPLDVWRAASALLLLAPETPLLFMGQEWAASTPFQYFTDHHGELGGLVSAGRRREFADFPAFHGGADVPDPQADATFTASKLRWEERERAPHAGVLALYRALLNLRRSERLLQPQAVAMDDVTVGLRYPSLAVVARLKGAGRVDRPAWLDASWNVVLTTEDAAFGGGTPPSLSEAAIAFPGPAAVIFRRG